MTVTLAVSDVAPPREPMLVLERKAASAPVKLIDARDGTEHPVRFVAGLFGVTQDPKTLALAPEFGWAIVHDPS